MHEVSDVPGLPEEGQAEGQKGQENGTRKGRTTQQKIDKSGREIYEKGGQITVLTDKQCDVKSQTDEDKTYRVSYGLDKFTCECPYHLHGKGCRCKHIAAVQYMLLQETKSPPKEEKSIDEVELKCPKCKSKEYVKNGKDKECKSGEKQRYKCKKCKRRFRDNLGFEHRQTASLFITLVLMLNGMRIAPFRIQMVLQHLSVDVHVDTITRWLEHYVGVVEEYTSPIKPPNLGSELGADEKRQDVKGKENYFVMAMDLHTRFILAWCTTACKQRYDATELLKAAVAKAGKPYPILITDGLAGYHTAFKNVAGSLKGFFMHITHTERVQQHQQAGEGQQHVCRSYQPGPGDKQRELAGLPHLPAVLQLHPATQRNRRQDSSRGCRHHSTWP